MELFDSLFQTGLLFGAIGGLTFFLITALISYTRNKKAPDNAIPLFFLYTIIGVIAAFAVLLADMAMDNDNFKLLMAFIAGVAGTTTIIQLVQKFGLENERDLLSEETQDEVYLLESAKRNIQQLQEELDSTKSELNETRLELERRENADLRAIIANLEDKPSSTDDDIMRDDDDDSQQNQQG